MRKLSATQIGTYRRCPMQWWFRYVAGIKMRPDVGLLRGRAVHKGVQVGFSAKHELGEDPPEELMTEATSAEFNAEVGNTKFEDDDPKPGELKDRTIALTQKHRHAIMPGIFPALVEYEMRFPLTETVEMAAYPDVITADGIHDTKTVSRSLIPDNPKDRAKSELKAEDEIRSNAQLAYYVIGAELQGIPVQHVALDRLVDLKGGAKAEKIMLARDQVDVDRARFVAQGVADGIEREVFTPIDDPKTCSWCGYKKICLGKPVWRYLGDPELARREARRVMEADLMP